jgi:hypothetical protein
LFTAKELVRSITFISERCRGALNIKIRVLWEV